MNKLLALLLFIPGLIWAASTGSLNDAPYVLRAVPDQTTPAGQPFVLNGYYYIACAPKQGGGSPTWSVTNPPPGMGMGVSNGLLQGSPSGSVSGVRIACLNPFGTASSNAFNWTVTVSGGIPAIGKFVDCSAATNGLGTVGQPWNRLTSVASMQPGEDLWIRGGVTPCLNTLTVAPPWEGTATDRVVVGTYFLVSGQAFQVTPVDPTLLAKDLTYANPRAALRGSYNAACRTWPSKCAFDVAGAVPQSKFGAMVTVAGSKYVTVQTLDIRDSAAGGILIDGFPDATRCTNQTACQDFTIIQWNKTDHTSYTGILATESQYSIIRGNEISYTGINRVDSQPAGVDGGAIYVVRCDPCHTIVENNYFHDIWNETLGLGLDSFVLSRGNQFAEGERVGAYTDGASDQVVEQNYYAGGRYTWETGLGDPGKIDGNGGPAFCSFCLVKEPGSTTIGNVANASLRIIFRNNVGATPVGALYVGLATDGATTASGGFWGNTMVGAAGMKGIRWGGNEAAVDASGIDFQNNALATTTGLPVCEGFTSTKVTRSHNWWSGNPAVTVCNGAGDVYSSFAALALQGGFTHFADSDATNFPTLAQFQIGVSSTASTGAAVLNQTYLNIAQWQWEYDNMTWKPACSTGKPSAADWAKKNAVDHCDKIRNGSYGALNHL